MYYTKKAEVHTYIKKYINKPFLIHLHSHKIENFQRKVLNVILISFINLEDKYCSRNLQYVLETLKSICKAVAPTTR